MNFKKLCYAFGNVQYNHNFTIQGLRAICKIINEYEKETNTKLEIDVVKICIQFEERTTKECSKLLKCKVVDVRGKLYDMGIICGRVGRTRIVLECNKI